VALRNVDKVITDNEVAVRDTFCGIFETFTASLSSNGEKITSIISTAEDSIKRRRRRARQGQVIFWAGSPATNMAANCCRP
jgi:hypothetical protein